MIAHSALAEAASIYRNRDDLDKEERTAAAVTLSGHRLWSNRQIADIVGLPRHVIDSVARRPERTGGRFVAEALEPTLELLKKRLNGETDKELAASIVEMGVSTSFLARLTGLSQRTIARAAGMP